MMMKMIKIIIVSMIMKVQQIMAVEEEMGLRKILTCTCMMIQLIYLVIGNLMA